MVCLGLVSPKFLAFLFDSSMSFHLFYTFFAWSQSNVNNSNALCCADFNEKVKTHRHFFFPYHKQPASWRMLKQQVRVVCSFSKGLEKGV